MQQAAGRCEQPKRAPAQRRLSAPASVEPDEPLAGAESSSSALEPPDGEAERQVCCQRRATSERHKLRQSQEGHQLQQRHGSASPLRNSSQSSSSSAASDSAFSRSQTTLGSAPASGRSSFAGSAHMKLDAGQSDSASSGAPSSLGAHSCASTPEAHFKIVWQNLSYRVPEKRLRKLLAAGAHAWRKLASKAVAATEPAHQVAPARRADLERASSAAEPASAAAAAAAASQGAKQRRVIFSNLIGCVKSGQLTAILGPSGAGKTTFLRCLTSAVEQGVSGAISIEGGLGAKTSQRLKLCIIPQKDYLFDNLTVMENLLFASRIKNTQSHFEHKQNVLRVAGLLGLHACLKLKTSRLSGGQYKRVSIAQELLSQPDILVLDEPTSGLDSLTCFRTVSVLRELVDLSRRGLMAPLAIVMTIHQPQIKIFNLFHRVYILSSMGRCVYEGKPSYLVQTVAEHCKLLPPADDQNPASFIIDLASEVYGEQPVEQLARLQLANFRSRLYKQVGAQRQRHAYHHKTHYREETASQLASDKHLSDSNKLAQQLAQFGPPLAVDDNDDPNDYNAGHATSSTKARLIVSERLRRRNSQQASFWYHTSLLVKRLWISMWRDSLLTTTRVLFHIIIPFVFYFVYSQKSGVANACPHVQQELNIQDMVSDSNMQRLASQHNELILTFENVSLFFLLLYSFSMCVLAVTALSFPLNMRILLKETSNGWYSMPRFVMAKTLADLPIELTMPIISISIAYAITGQPSSHLGWRMLAVTGVMTLCSLISQTQGLLFGAYFMNNVQAAVFVSQASTLPWIMLSGFTTRVSELPHLLQWLSFGSIYRLGIESIVAVRYGFGMCPCEPESLDGRPPRLVGIPEQLRSLIRYYIDSAGQQQAQDEPQAVAANSTQSSVETSSITGSSSDSRPDLFEKIAISLSRANTYGVDVASCHQVRPFIMTAREVEESTLLKFVIILVCILIALKLLLFAVVRVRTS